jgi:hypothetical protein
MTIECGVGHANKKSGAVAVGLTVHVDDLVVTRCAP